jgi:hypothetical protein
MPSIRLLIAVGIAAAAAAAGCAHRAPPAAPAGATLAAFESEEALARYHAAIVRQHEKLYREMGPMAVPPPPPPPAAPPPPGAEAGAAESVTNVQHAGVDEGGIVKVHGDHLVILRRGRLFTVRIGDGALEPVSAVDAFGPGIEPQGAWYDEMLVSGDRVIVIGYSYARGGTEVGLFRIDAGGGLHHASTHNLRSGDYYSSRNYASRLIGDRLVFYAPIPLGDTRELAEALPAIRRWEEGADGDAFRPTVSARRVYRPAGPLTLDDGVMLHAVTVCGIDGDALACESTALVGPGGRVFYVSPTAVYVWTTGAGGRRGAGRSGGYSVVYRLPLDGGAPTGLRVGGAPVDQFSFLESGDGHLNVLVRAEGRGESMWGAEHSRGDAALLRVPLASFGDGSGAAPQERYRALPPPASGPLQNRFVGDWLLYGVGSGWARPRGEPSTAWAVRWAGGGDPAELSVPHGVDRIEAMGSGAVLVGGDGSDLHFSGVRLSRGAALAHRYVRPGVAQGETRSHGFFYRADGEERGLLGLPIRGAAEPGYAHLRQGSASILFLRNDAFELRELGDLAADAGAGAGADDGCRASCVDWYGNARPLFLRGRVFALLGYELVEGAEDDRHIHEVRRASFAPRR